MFGYNYLVISLNLDFCKSDLQKKKKKSRLSFKQKVPPLAPWYAFVSTGHHFYDEAEKNQNTTDLNLICSKFY